MVPASSSCGHGARQKIISLRRFSMKHSVGCLLVVISLLGSSCVTQKLRVDEWNHGLPGADSDPLIPFSKTRQARFSDIQIVDLGKSQYANHPKTGKAFQTVDKAGAPVEAVVTTDNQTNHYYSLSSFKPVILQVAPETVENFVDAKKFQNWSGYVMQVGLAVVGAAVAFSPAGVVIAYSYVFPGLMGVSGILEGASRTQYGIIKDKYDSTINQRKSANKVVEGKPEPSPAAATN
jgi:hypothetical protein